MTKTTSIIAMLAVAAFAVAGCAKDDKNDSGEAAKTAEGDTAEKPEKATPEEDVADETTMTEEIGEVAVDELATMLGEAEGDCVAVDANSEKTREKYGIIPDATVLTSYKEYDIKELPQSKDTKLVFYCTNEQCGASKKAASQAILAGYHDVHVLPAGIAGWVEAGNETAEYTN